MDLSKIREWLPQERLKQVLIVVGAAILLVTFSVVLKSCYERRIISDHETSVKAEVLEKTKKSNDNAAEARASDSITLHEKSEERKDAISKASDEAPADADNDLNCKRLRQAGYDTSAFPSCS